jgi:hypothetical protein
MLVKVICDSLNELEAANYNSFIVDATSYSVDVEQNVFILRY